MSWNSLIKHPFWEASDPRNIRLVRVSRELPPDLNPFAKDGVVLKAAAIPGEAPHSKWVVARNGIYDGVKKGKIYLGMKGVIEATSGNTGLGEAVVCNALGIPFTAVMPADVPPDKETAIRVIGRQTLVQYPDPPESSAVEYARRRGSEDGMYNPDQYAGAWNPEAQYLFFAPQLWEQQPTINLLFTPGGTLGMAIGCAKFARHKGCGTTVVPVLCEEQEEVPGARSLSKIKKDVLLPIDEFFTEEQFEFGKRRASFVLSFLSWSYVFPHLGPSFGLGLAGAFRFLYHRKQEGSLDEFRGPDGKIHTVVIGPDDCRPYLPLYFGELKQWEHASSARCLKDLRMDLSVLLGQS